MIKKTLSLTAAILLLAACSTTEQAEPSTDRAAAEAPNAAEQPKERAIEKIPEEPAEEPALDLLPLAEKIWSNPEQSYFLHFTTITDEQMEFRFLDATSPKASEQIFTAKRTEHDAAGWSGMLLPVAGSVHTTETNEFFLQETGDSYRVGLGDLSAFALQESILTFDEWEDKKKVLPELSDLEAVELIERIETESAERFGAAFTETLEGYSFTESFESIVAPIRHLYADTYTAGTLKDLYDHPIDMLETLYAFPLAETRVIDHAVYRSPGQLTVYTESEFYGYPAYTRFILTAEDKEWKISSRDPVLDGGMAEYAALTVSGDGENPDAYAELLSPGTFQELAERIQSGGHYYVSTHLDYDDIQVYVWLYQVDPITGTVYSYDRVNDRAEEIGTLPDGE